MSWSHACVEKYIVLVDLGIDHFSLYRRSGESRTFQNLSRSIINYRVFDRSLWRPILCRRTPGGDTYRPDCDYAECMSTCLLAILHNAGRCCSMQSGLYSIAVILNCTPETELKMVWSSFSETMFNIEKNLKTETVYKPKSFCKYPTETESLNCEKLNWKSFLWLLNFNAWQL